MFRLIAFLLLAALGASMAAAQQSTAPPVARVVATDFTLPAKFERMAAWAAEEGYRLDWRLVEGAVPPQELVSGADFLLFDGPRPNDMAAIEKAVGGFDADLRVPWIAVGGGPPRFGNLDPGVARRVIGYFAGGGAGNLRALVQAIPIAMAAGDLSVLPPPVGLGKAGLYHPAASAPFANASAFRDWATSQGWAERPVVAIAMSDGLVRDMQTGVIDAVAKALAARGMVAAPFWYDEADPQALAKVVLPLRAQAIVNMTHMQNGTARAAEFSELDVPVIQVVASRLTSANAWRAATSGIPATGAAVQLSVPESWGISDPLVLSVVEKGVATPIPEQVNLLAGKLQRLAALRGKPAADKKIALFFWNYPAGEKNLAASHLNLPKSISNVSQALAAAGYRVDPATEQAVIDNGQAMLGGYYRPETLGELEKRGLVARLPLSAYRAWLAGLPPGQRREIESRWGDPANSRWVRGGDLLIPRLTLGNLTVLPQPPRGDNPTKSYHDQKIPPDHIYLAAYLWVRANADAIVHLGTHGTQEWTPGKDRGLWASDYPFLLVGDLPVFYPYIQDNVAEAIQARRRGRAVTISHQTPAFGPSGLYDELRDIHALIHEYAQLEDGGVRDRVARQIRTKASAAGLDGDLDWDDAAINRNFAGYYSALHDHLHQVARSAIPMGLHSFGEPAKPEHRLTTVMQQLGPDYLKALGDDPAEAFAENFEEIATSTPYRTLSRYLRDGESAASITDAALRTQIERALVLDKRLESTAEMEALLAALEGRFVRPGAGGDPVRNPDVESGRNLFAFEAEKVPTKAAYVQGGQMLDKLVAAHRSKHGKPPEKLAFVMFSGETIRQLGVVEGQILNALGLRPVWGRGDRVERLEVVPLSELGRPRIDVVVQASSVYRDQFDGFMRLLAGGIDRIAGLDEPNGPSANARELEQRLVAGGIDRARAGALSRLRIFSNAPGDYGSGLPEQIGKKNWAKETDLADPFLERLQYAYGAREWGTATEGQNLFAEQLRGVDAAVLSRSSTLHGLLSTDHPFEYLGGVSLAVRNLTGKTPDLYVADLRSTEGQITSTGAFLSTELRSRYLNPQWIKAMQAEGYAGANEMLGIVNNLWGWQVTDPASVRPDQWQAMHDTYVRDVRSIGINGFFARVHPTAQRAIVERMLEAVSRGYWKADEATQSSLRDKLAEIPATAPGELTREMVRADGYGVVPPIASSRPGRAAAEAERTPATDASRLTRPAPQGIVLKRVPPEPPRALRTQNLVPFLLALLILFLWGAGRELRLSRPPVAKLG